MSQNILRYFFSLDLQLEKLAIIYAMSLRNLGFGWLQVSITIASIIATSANSSVAQITPDGTLPDNSQVRVEDNTRVIEGGTQAGDNLFHSFSEFSVPTGLEAWFNNSTDIQNIFSRVTGGSVSNIDGLIRANGAANLFLLNPNGIIFGPNASLDVGGSFVGTSAESLKFADGSEFSAVNPQSPPLLTINVPMGLQYGPNPGEIAVNESRLQVNKGKTLGLIGGNVSISGGESGFIRAEGGRIELGGLAATGQIGINGQQLEEEFSLESFSFPEGIARANVQLSNSAYIDVRSDGGGSIAINAKALALTGGEQGRSELLAGIAPNNGSPEAQAGDITINATDNITVSQESRIVNQVAPTGVGNGGELTITTGQLLVKDGAQIGAGTFGAGKGGNLTVTASESIQVIGESADARVASGLFASTQGEGDGGELTITTGQLLVQDGAQIDTGTLGAGQGGNLTVTARETIEVIGRSADGEASSGLFASSEEETSGDAGNLTISTGQLLIKDGAQVSAGTFGAGNGGNLTVTAKESITVIGSGSSDEGVIGSGLSTQANQGATGNAGNLTIETGQLLVQDGARISASTFGAGKGGNLTVTADTLQLKDGGTITAQSTGTGIAGNININIKDNLNADNGQIITQAERSRGGNITITAGENIFLNNNSDIRTTLSTTAGSGGNITLKANAIVALEDSDILAFAPQGRGGNITFNTNAFLSDSLFNTTAQTTDPLTESELNQLDGNNRVDVNATGSISSGNISGIPDTSQLQNSLTQLTTNAIDTEALVASSCVAPSRERRGTFYIVGQASLPYRPGEAVPSVYSAVGVQPIPQETPPTPRWKKGDPIIEPTGVYLLENGQRAN